MVSHVHRHDEEEIYKKIRDTIDRNDFRSAQHMLDKYRCDMPSGTVAKLVDYLDKKEKNHRKMEKRRNKKKYLPLSWWLRALDKELGALIILIIIFFVGCLINFRYYASYYYYVRSGIGTPQENLFNEIVALIIMLDLSVIFGIASRLTKYHEKKGDKKFFIVMCVICVGLFLRLLATTVNSYL
ncbi:hypothetical protein [Intestinimonas butyriciproducens]|uniref:hypothetical protein n=1 Tax=Intestinimonas butyriciproducens TaxID=1297617 RepID=UPI00195AB378|nr:hypothetical protein [Intestinimonas butyriciproducens]MBM6977197.1 hypothetical protein [Intestinimonas butyriciproducens]